MVKKVSKKAAKVAAKKVVTKKAKVKASPPIECNEVVVDYEEIHSNVRLSEDDLSPSVGTLSDTQQVNNGEVSPTRYTFPQLSLF